MKFFGYVILGFLACLCGCAKKSEAEALRATYETEGWTFLENLGPSVVDGVFMASSSSETARVITAFSSDGRTREKKEYVQDSALYLVAAFQSPKSGASYCMVFQKKKPNKAPEPTPTAVTSPAAQEPRQP